MTEQEWLECADPRPMLSELGTAATMRKQRLLGLACCRRLSDLLQHGHLQQALRTADAWIEGTIGPALRKQARRAAHATAAAASGSTLEAGLTLSDSAAWAVQRLLKRGSLDVSHLLFALAEARLKEVGARTHLCGTPQQVREIASLEARKSAERGQCDLLRDIFGNPFRPIAVDPAWLTSTVVSLATAMHADRAFDRLPILADALEVAGCDNTDVLNHCRQPGEHVRGCWVVDLLLNKR